MRALSGSCEFSSHSARLKELVKRFGGGQSELDAEYTKHLLEHCRELLKQIRAQNLDL